MFPASGAFTPGFMLPVILASGLSSPAAEDLVYRYTKSNPSSRSR